MKVLVINGSPKRNNSDTLKITDAFVQGMSKSIDVCLETVHTVDLNVKYCKGCFACMRSGKCVIDDDMESILRKMLNSDLLLFSFPLYCYGMPASLKAVIDRILPLSKMDMQKVGDRYEHVGQRDYSHLRYLMICGCGFPNSKRNFEPAVMQFGLLFPQNATVITVPECPMFGVPAADIVTKPRLELFEEAGRQYAANGVIDNKLAAEISSPLIPEEDYVKIVNGN